jgi:hypothetical protein
LALRDVQRFQVMFVGQVLVGVSLTSVGIGISRQLLRINMDAVYYLCYALMFFAMVAMTRNRRQKCPSDQKMAPNSECRKSLRFITCLLGIYLHAPLLLANYSLGLSSAVVWSPLLGTLVLSPSAHAFLIKNRVVSLLLKMVGGMILVATSPPILLVPRIFPSYTTYVLGVYTPLHLLLAVLWMM